MSVRRFPEEVGALLVEMEADRPPAGRLELDGPDLEVPGGASEVVWLLLGAGCVAERKTSASIRAPLPGAPSDLRVATTVKVTFSFWLMGLAVNFTWYLQSSSSASALSRVGP